MSLYVGCSTTTRVDAGHVGIRVKLAGSDRGVQDMPVVTGWVVYNPLTEQIILFPTSVQNVVWTQSAHEGKAFDESITFSSSEGVNVNADIGLSFHIDSALAPKLYGRFRLNDLEKLSDGYMHNTVREAFNDVASKLAVQDIYGAGKSKMLAEVTQKCRDVFGKDGIVIDQLTINGTLRLPQNVSDAINRAMEATQNAIQSRNRVAQVEAEATQAITQAHGAAEAARQKAQGDADALLINGPRPGAGQRDHPPFDDARRPSVPRDRALGRQAPVVQRRGLADAHVRRRQGRTSWRRRRTRAAPEGAARAVQAPGKPGRPGRPGRLERNLGRRAGAGSARACCLALTWRPSRAM